VLLTRRSDPIPKHKSGKARIATGELRARDDLIAIVVSPRQSSLRTPHQR
jgi:hypothetical protein